MKPSGEPISDSSLPILVINLDRSPDRKRFMRRQLERYGLTYERVRGVDGADLSPAEIRSLSGSAGERRRRFFRPLIPGEVGCYASHRACWHLIVENGLDAAVVLEDDVDLSPGFVELLPALSALSSRFEYIRLSNLRRGSVRLRAIDAQHSVVAHCRPPYYCVAQVVSASGARKLLKHAPPYLRPVDIDLQFPWEIDGLTIVSVSPPVARHRGSPGGSRLPTWKDQEFSSDIGSRSGLSNYSALAKLRFDSSLAVRSWFRFWSQYGLRASLNVALGRQHLPAQRDSGGSRGG